MMEYLVTQVSPAPGDQPDMMAAMGPEEILVKVEDLDSSDYWEFPGCRAERGRRGNLPSPQPGGKDFRATPAPKVFLAFREFQAFLDHLAPGVPQELLAQPVALDLQEPRVRRVTMGSVTRGFPVTRVIPGLQVYQEVLWMKSVRLSDEARGQEKRVIEGLREKSDTQGSRELLVQRERKEKKELWDSQALGEPVV